MLKLTLMITARIMLAAHLLMLAAAVMAPERPPIRSPATWQVVACDDFQKDRSGCGLVPVPPPF